MNKYVKQGYVSRDSSLSPMIMMGEASLDVYLSKKMLIGPSAVAGRVL